MDKTADTSADMFEIVEWLQINRQRVIATACVVAVAAAAVGIFFWHKNYAESEANAALADVPLPRNAQEAALPAYAEPYLKVADQYPGTRGAERALLLAAGILFDAGKFDASRAAFERFLNEYSSSPYANEALLGVASSLEASGKTAEAAARYEELISHRQADFMMPQAKSALARCDVALNKPDKALALYQELAKANNNDTWTAEARMRGEELLAKYPALAQPKVAPAAPTTTQLSIPGVNVPAIKAPPTNKP